MPQIWGERNLDAKRASVPKLHDLCARNQFQYSRTTLVFLSIPSGQLNLNSHLKRIERALRGQAAAQWCQAEWSLGPWGGGEKFKKWHIQHLDMFYCFIMTGERCALSISEHLEASTASDTAGTVALQFITQWKSATSSEEGQCVKLCVCIQCDTLIHWSSLHFGLREILLIHYWIKRVACTCSRPFAGPNKPIRPMLSKLAWIVGFMTQGPLSWTKEGRFFDTAFLTFDWWWSMGVPHGVVSAGDLFNFVVPERQKERHSKMHCRFENKCFHWLRLNDMISCAH